jgi:hypothetical protein
MHGPGKVSFLGVSSGKPIDVTAKLMKNKNMKHVPQLTNYGGAYRGIAMRSVSRSLSKSNQLWFWSASAIDLQAMSKKVW